MTEEFDTTQDELQALKDKATVMGITFHPSIGLEKLRDKVNEVLAEKEKEAEKLATKTKEPAQNNLSERELLQQEATRLVRVRVTCMNPAKKEWAGEIFTVGNSVVGSLKKYVPFDNEEGWHIPYMMYQMLQEKKFQTFYDVKLPNGVKIRQGKLVKEFGIELLPDLTKEELSELARRQALGKHID